MVSQELRDWIAKYIENEISLQELESWTVSRLPLLIRDPSSTDADLVAAIELCLAEFSEGIRTEDEVRSYLRQALQEHNIIYLHLPQTEPPQTDFFLITGSSSRLINWGFDLVSERESQFFIINAEW
jgi:hypothetical protein